MTLHVSAPQQEALWWIQQRSSRKDVYNLTWRMSVAELDPQALQRAWQTIVERHEVLRTGLVEQDGAVWQQIHPRMAAEINEMSWSSSANTVMTSGRTLLDEIAIHLHQRPFHLDRAPLARLSLIRVGAQSELLLTVHHAVLDGWSMQQVVTELASAYRAEREQPGSSPKAFTTPAVAFLTYAEAARQAAADGSWRSGIEYWVGRLSDVEYATVIPDRPQPAGPTAPGAAGAVLRHRLSDAARAGVAALTERGGMTPFAAYLAALYTVLGRGGAGPGVAVGVAVANRLSERDGRCVGYLTNVVVTSGEVAGSDTLDDVVARIRDDFWDSLPYHQVPFSLVHEALPVQARERLGATPPVLLTYHGSIGGGVPLGGRDTELLSSPSTSATNHLAFGVFEEKGGTVLEVEYDVSRFEAATVRRLFADLERVLEHGRSADVPTATIRIDSRTSRAQRVPSLPVSAAADEVTDDAPASELASTIDAIWRRTLRLSASSMDSNFFALGGHSLQVFELMAEVFDRSGGQVDIMEWLDHPTFGKLVELTEQSLIKQNMSHSDVALLRTGTEYSQHLHLIHPAGGADHATYRDLAAALPETWRITVSPDDDLETIAEMADHYVDALLAEPRLPDMIGGWSLGGLISYAMALRLRRDGITPPRLLLIDPSAPDGSGYDEGYSDLDSFIYTILRGVGAVALIPEELRLAAGDVEHGLGVLDALLAGFGSPLSMDALRRRFEVLKRHWSAMTDYISSEPVNVPTLLVVAELTEADIRQWRTLLGDDVTVLRVNTDHYSAAKGRYAKEIAEVLRRLSRVAAG